MLVHLLWLRVHVHYQVFIALQWSQFITTIFLFYGHFQNVLAKKKFVKMCLSSVGDGCHRSIYNYDILHTQVESSLGVVLIWWKWSGGKNKQKKIHESMRYWIVMTIIFGQHEVVFSSETLACQGQRCTFISIPTQSPVQVIRGDTLQIISHVIINKLHLTYSSSVIKLNKQCFAASDPVITVGVNVSSSYC